LLNAQILSHSMKTTDLLEPWAMMNCCSASTVSPRRIMPLTVGSLGSSQPSTAPVSTSHVSFLFDITVLVRLSRAYAQMLGLRRLRASMNQLNWSSLSMYSVVRSACVTPSTLSTMGQAKS